jgi:co-chaperonin GroES (HSP10)
MKTRINPHVKGILIEFSEIEQTKSGVYLPDGTQKEDIQDYDGDVVIKVGKEVSICKEGDTVMFFPHSIPTSFNIEDFDGKKHKYMLFREADVACVVEPLNGKIIELPLVK